MKAWTLFLPLVASETYGAPKVLQLEHIRNAAIEFCERTKAWQEEQAAYPLPTSVLGSSPFVDFQSDTQKLVHEILAAGLRTSGTAATWPVTPRTAQWCDQRYPGWQHAGVVGTPDSVVQISPDQFAPVPAASGGPWEMLLHVAYKPTRTATSGPDFLYNDYYEQIAAGAKARLMAMPGKAWSNPQLAGVYASVFDAAITKANSRQAHGFGRGRVRVKAQFQ
jgi:hypothetical protein